MGNYCKTNMSGLQDTQTLQRDADMLISAWLCRLINLSYLTLLYTKSCTNLFNTHGCKYISPFLSPKAQLQYYTSLQRLDVEMSKLQKSGPKCLKSWFQMSKLADNIRTHPYKYLQWIKEYLQWVCKLSVSYVLKLSQELAHLLRFEHNDLRWVNKLHVQCSGADARR